MGTADVVEAILRALAEDLRDRGKLDLTEAFVDGGLRPGEVLDDSHVLSRPHASAATNRSAIAFAESR